MEFNEKNNSLEKPESKFEKLDNLMLQISEQINNEYKEDLGCDLVDEKGAIRMNAFARKNNGPYDKESKTEEGDSIERDKKILKKKKITLKPDIYTMEEWEERKEKNANTQAEKMITSIMYKVLETEFLIVRTSEFDDYENGIDNLIINKKTGEVVGAFDEVYDSFHQEEVGFEKNKKWKKIIRKNNGNQNRVKYGVTFEEQDDEQKIVRKAINNLPVFFLSINKEDFENIVQDLEVDLNQKPSDTELQVFDKLINSLEEQREKLLKENVTDQVKVKLEKFEESLNLMKEIKKNHFE